MIFANNLSDCGNLL